MLIGVTLTGAGGQQPAWPPKSPRNWPMTPDGVGRVGCGGRSGGGARRGRGGAGITQPGKSVSELAAALRAGSGCWCSTTASNADAAADLIEAILAQSATVRIAATSREGLKGADEQLWSVPSLTQRGIDSAAVNLFVERAQSVALALLDGHS
jgi:hypothetical protein